MLQCGEIKRYGAEMMRFFPCVLCVVDISYLKKHFVCRLPADRHHSCSQHGCEIARAENFTTSLRTSVSFWLCMCLCWCICLCVPYKDIWVTHVWIKHYDVRNTWWINRVTVKAAWVRKTSRERWRHVSFPQSWCLCLRLCLCVNVWHCAFWPETQKDTDVLQLKPLALPL